MHNTTFDLVSKQYLSKKPKHTIEMKHVNGMKYVALPGRWILDVR